MCKKVGAFIENHCYICCTKSGIYKQYIYINVTFIPISVLHAQRCKAYSGQESSATECSTLNCLQNTTYNIRQRVVVYHANLTAIISCQDAAAIRAKNRLPTFP
jgi:hypothetical protein